MQPLLSGRDRCARTADRQYAVPARGIVEAPDEVLSEVIIANRLARGQGSISKYQERISPPHALNLAGQRLEVCGRPHDGVSQSRLDQLRLERELGVLKRQQRLLYA